jgi:argininosuccinate synthase
MVYYGFWYHAKFDALLAFIRDAQKTVTGEVTLNLYKGNLQVANAPVPQFVRRRNRHHGGGGSYNQTDAEGFLRIQGLLAASKAALRLGSISGLHFAFSPRQPRYL